ncbi:MAG TPA: PH domain-containing protein [Solirubrobacterales bacterium]|nr:PH domain-containing protein [Solirubrobacterales bacterium]
MPSLDEIRDQISHLDGTSRVLGRKEIKQLPNILWEDERVERIVQGVYNDGLGVLVATNKRLVFVDKGLFGLRVEDFPYDKVSSIEYKTGALTGKITFFASGNKAEIKQVSKGQCRGFAEFVRARSTAPTAHASAPPPAAHLDQLERLVKLRDAGALTSEEFESQKAKLLGP